MALTEIKSVRIRGKQKPKNPGGLDGRLSLKTDGKDRSIIVYLSDTDNPYYSEFTPVTYPKKYFKEKSDDEVINDYLKNPNSGHSDWTIIQDPFDAKVIPEDPPVVTKELKRVRVRTTRQIAALDEKNLPGDLDGLFILDEDDSFYKARLYYIGSLPNEGTDTKQTQLGATSNAGQDVFFRWQSAMSYDAKLEKISYAETIYKGRETELINLIIRNPLFMSGNYLDWRVIQDPYDSKVIPTDDVYKKRVYGHDYYPLNNGAKVRILWHQSIGSPTSSNDKKTGLTHSLTDLTDAELKSLDIKKNVIIESPQMPISDGIVLNNQKPIDKKFNTETINGYNKNFAQITYKLTANGDLVVSQSNLPPSLTEPNYQIPDSEIQKLVLDKLKSQMQSKLGVESAKNELKFLTQGVSNIPFDGFIEKSANNVEKTNFETGITASIPTVKYPLTIKGLDDNLTVKAKQDLPEFEVYVGEISSTDLKNSDQFDELEELDPEYQESDWKGEEETGMTLEIWKTQTTVAKGQEDCSGANAGGGDGGGGGGSTTPGTSNVDKPIDPGPITNFNKLAEIAGKWARKLGKNPRVNAENMKLSYKKGVHGLCPQGTQAVLAALLGTSKVSLTGNADWFSFKSPTRPAGGDGRGNFASTGFYNDKIRITQVNGSWKGTYLMDPKQWQVGDVVAMGYVSNDYGHIQCWTGTTWMSDFYQGNNIQQGMVDNTSVAMWRLNAKGIEQYKKQQQNPVY